MPKYDSIIIGGGHNGLVTAAYLARAGRTVLVLERRELLGGCAVTEEIWPGYRVSTGAYLTSLMQERIVRELELERHGYEVDAKDSAFFSAFPDGRHLFMWQDRARTLAEIARFSRHDAEVYPSYEDQLERISQVVEGLLLTTPPQFPPQGLGDAVDYLKLAGRMRGLSANDVVALVKIFTQSAAEFLDEWFESEQVKVTLATDGVIGANGGPRSPGTAYILLHHCMGEVAGHRGLWGFVRGGMGAVSEAIARSARASGAVMRTEAPVAKVLVRSGRAYAVVLESGEEIEGGSIASNLDPKLTFLRLVDPRDLDPEFLAAIRHFRIEGTSCKINLALNGLPEFTAYPGAPGPHHRATMHICPSIDYVERAWDDAKYGRPSDRPLLELTIPTMYDPSLAPPGKHIVGIFLQYAPYTLREGTWDEMRDPFANRVISLIEEYAPNIRGLIEHRQVLTPLDLERRFGITGGNIFHGEMSLDQMFVMRPVAGWARYRTPIQGLYLCGSGAHPGGGVMGAPGYNCAREMLKGPAMAQKLRHRMSTRALRLDLKLMDGRMAVCRLSPAEDLPVWALGAGGFFSLTRTADEWSVVCSADIVPPGTQCETDWRILQVAGPLDFSLTGILASIAGPLAVEGVSIFALATYDTDYVMVKSQNLERAARALEAAGHRVLL